MPEAEREDAEKRFKQLTAGHNLLSDPTKRRQYDAGKSKSKKEALPCLHMSALMNRGLVSMLPFENQLVAKWRRFLIPACFPRAAFLVVKD